MKRIVQPSELDDGQMHFTYRRMRAERIAAGELRDAGSRARAGSFLWPLAVTPQLWRDIETLPRGRANGEDIPVRWQHIVLLATTAARQIIRDRLSELKMNVVLRTTDAPDKSREHIKRLCLAVEHAEDGGETFSLGYCAEK